MNHDPFQVVVGFDFSEQSACALDQAIQLGMTRADASVHVVGAVEGKNGIRVVGVRHIDTDVAAELEAQIEVAIGRVMSRWRADVSHHVHVRYGGAAEQILTVAQEVMADLVIVGTHGRRGLRRLAMGSVAEAVMRQASCPVLVMRDTHYAMTDAELSPEPPCPRCVEQRELSDGQDMWCQVHAEAYRPSAVRMTRARRDSTDGGWIVH